MLNLDILTCRSFSPEDDPQRLLLGVGEWVYPMFACLGPGKRRIIMADLPANKGRRARASMRSCRVEFILFLFLFFESNSPP